MWKNLWGLFNTKFCSVSLFYNAMFLLLAIFKNTWGNPFSGNTILHIYLVQCTSFSVLFLWESIIYIVDSSLGFRYSLELKNILKLVGPQRPQIHDLRLINSECLSRINTTVNLLWSRRTTLRILLWKFVDFENWRKAELQLQLCF